MFMKILILILNSFAQLYLSLLLYEGGEKVNKVLERGIGKRKINQRVLEVTDVAVEAPIGEQQEGLAP